MSKGIPLGRFDKEDASAADPLRAIESAGFRDIRVVRDYDYFGKSPSAIVRRIARCRGESVVLRAVKDEALKRK